MNSIIFIILCIIYLLALFVNQKILYGVYFVFLIFLLASRQKLTYKPLTVTLSLLIPLIWTIFLSSNYLFYNNIQGLFYLSMPIMMIIIGYQISKLLSLRQILIYLVYLGTILALVYITIAVYKVGFQAFLSPYEKARIVIGSGSPACILSLIISIYSKKYGFKIFRDNFQRIVFIVLNTVAIYLFASRTYWVVLLTFILIFNIQFILRHKVLSFASFFLGLFVILNFTSSSTAKLNSTKILFTKILNSFSELRFSNFSKYSDINIHYRGYEAYRAFKTYSEGTPANILFGHGLGKQIELNASVYLDGSFRSVIPWIHNGYFFILLKEGVFGLISLFVFLFYNLKIGLKGLEKNNTEKRFMSLLMIGSTVSMLLTNYVICSIFTIEMALVLITIGFLLQTLKPKIRDENKINQIFNRN